MHTATLLHDDVVDESDMRRGKVAARIKYPGRDLAAAHVALVDHVVVQERRGVHELDAGGELDLARPSR
jgi:geranylgeranyl pyrophosphate synthase